MADDNIDKHQDSVLQQDVNATAESLDLPDTRSEKDKAQPPFPELSSAFLDDIEGLKRRILELEALQAEASDEHTEKQERDSHALAEIEQYKRMESCLYNHRKEWEMSGGPGTWWGTTDTTRRIVGAGEHGKYGQHEWTIHHPFLHQDHYYARPNVFDADHDCNPPSEYVPDGKDEYDSIIDWGNRRDRLRKNFEWQMDRLFLNEELHMRKQEKLRASMRTGPRERPMAEADAEVEDQSTHVEVPPAYRFAHAELQWMEWYHFRLLSRVDEREACAVDVLIGDPAIDDDGGANQLWFGSSGHRANRNTAKTSGQKPFDPMQPAKSPLPERIRIHSSVLVRILAIILDPDGGDFPEEGMSVVIIRPFKALVRSEQALRDWCNALRKKLRKNSIVQKQNPAIDLSSADDESEQSIDSSEDIEANAYSDNGEDIQSNPVDSHKINQEMKTDTGEEKTAEPHQVADKSQIPDGDYNPTLGATEISDATKSPLALDHLQCLLDFIDSTLVVKREYLHGPQCRKVFFSDLWHLFRPGIEVIDRAGKQAYKVIGVTSAKHRVFRSWERWSSDNPRNPQSKVSAVTVKCVYIDFDGKNIGPVLKTFEFKRFDSEREITSFEIYPLRLHVAGRSEYDGVEWQNVEQYPVEERYRRKLILRGEKFLEVAGVKHMYYAGPTLEVKEEVESPVVVDFETAFTARKDLPPPSMPVGGWRSREEAEIAHSEHMQQQWKPVLTTLIGSAVFEESDPTSPQKTSCLGDCCQDEYVHDDQFVDQQQSTDYINSLLPHASNLDEQPPIMIIPRPLKELQIGSSRSITCPESDMVIMSYRVFGFVLRSRKWAKLDLSYLNDVAVPKLPPSSNNDVDLNLQNSKQKDENASLTLNRLVLEKGHHSMIISLIAQHFRDKRSTTGQREEFDLVKGKGKGLIILLHGAPGVGKTSTAEGVAEMFEKPLFQITCGDLGTTAAEVENALEMTFSLANKWDCILLLDEADVFLAERTKEDFKRNGLVAVFLRLMEYYSGILFLTTNRVGDFDEAFTSRIHVSLYYPELNEDKTVKVFKINMDMIEERFRKKNRVINIDRIEIGSFAAKYFAEFPNARWNGRQIRNACQTALALAEFEAQDGSLEDTENSDKPVTLTIEHFTVVRDAYLEFTKYMHNLYGTTSARRAKESRLRAVWVDENNNLVDTASMSGPKDKKNAFLVASQSQAPRPMGQMPQQSFQQQQQPQQPPYPSSFVGSYQQPHQLQQQQMQYQNPMQNQAFGTNQPQFANTPSGYPQRESYPANQNWNNQSPGPYLPGSQASIQQSASGSQFEQPLQHNEPNIHR